MRIRKATAVVVSLLVILVAAACFFDVYITTAYSCLECRARRDVRRICGISFASISYDSDSAAMFARAPSHQHQWRWCGSTTKYSLLSEVHACGRGHPIWMLQASFQNRYAQLVSASEFQNALQAIDSPDTRTATAAVIRIGERVIESLNGEPLRPTPSASPGEPRK